MLDSPYEHGSGAEVPKREIRMECVCAPCVRKEEEIIARRAEQWGMRAVSGFERMKRANGRRGLQSAQDGADGA